MARSRGINNSREAFPSEPDKGFRMTLNFETLKASAVLYGLDAVYAILLLAIGWWPSSAVWGQPIINHSAYPGTGELSMSFPVPAGASADAIREQILQDLRNDLRVDRGIEPAVHLSRVIDVANRERPVVELTVSAHVSPSDVDAVKQKVLDRIGTLIAPAARS
jgi:hypothetical protein